MEESKCKSLTRDPGTAWQRLMSHNIDHLAVLSVTSSERRQSSSTAEHKEFTAEKYVNQENSCENTEDQHIIYTPPTNDSITSSSDTVICMLGLFPGVTIADTSETENRQWHVDETYPKLGRSKSKSCVDVRNISYTDEVDRSFTLFGNRNNPMASYSDLEKFHSLNGKSDSVVDLESSFCEHEVIGYQTTVTESSEIEGFQTCFDGEFSPVVSLVPTDDNDDYLKGNIYQPTDDINDTYKHLEMPIVEPQGLPCYVQQRNTVSQKQLSRNTLRPLLRLMEDNIASLESARKRDTEDKLKTSILLPCDIFLPEICDLSKENGTIQQGIDHVNGVDSMTAISCGCTTEDVQCEHIHAQLESDEACDDSVEHLSFKSTDKIPDECIVTITEDDKSIHVCQEMLDSEQLHSSMSSSRASDTVIIDIPLEACMAGTEDRLDYGNIQSQKAPSTSVTDIPHENNDDCQLLIEPETNIHINDESYFRNEECHIGVGSINSDSIVGHSTYSMLACESHNGDVGCLEFKDYQINELMNGITKDFIHGNTFYDQIKSHWGLPLKSSKLLHTKNDFKNEMHIEFDDDPWPFPDLKSRNMILTDSQNANVQTAQNSINKDGDETSGVVVSNTMTSEVCQIATDNNYTHTADSAICVSEIDAKTEPQTYLVVENNLDSRNTVHVCSNIDDLPTIHSVVFENDTSDGVYMPIHDMHPSLAHNTNTECHVVTDCKSTDSHVVDCTIGECENEIRSDWKNIVHSKEHPTICGLKYFLKIGTRELNKPLTEQDALTFDKSLKLPSINNLTYPTPTVSSNQPSSELTFSDSRDVFDTAANVSSFTGSQPSPSSDQVTMISCDSGVSKLQEQGMGLLHHENTMDNLKDSSDVILDNSKKIKKIDQSENICMETAARMQLRDMIESDTECVMMRDVDDENIMASQSSLKMCSTEDYIVQSTYETEHRKNQQTKKYRKSCFVKKRNSKSDGINSRITYRQQPTMALEISYFDTKNIKIDSGLFEFFKKSPMPLNGKRRERQNVICKKRKESQSKIRKQRKEIRDKKSESTTLEVDVSTLDVSTCESTDLSQSSIECLLEMLIQRGTVDTVVVLAEDGSLLAKCPGQVDISRGEASSLLAALRSGYRMMLKLPIMGVNFTCVACSATCLATRQVLVGTCGSRVLVAQQGVHTTVVALADSQSKGCPPSPQLASPHLASPHLASSQLASSQGKKKLCDMGPSSCVKDVQELVNVLALRGL